MKLIERITSIPLHKVTKKTCWEMRGWRPIKAFGKYKRLKELTSDLMDEDIGIIYTKEGYKHVRYIVLTKDKSISGSAVNIEEAIETIREDL